VRKKAEGEGSGSFCWTVDGFLGCVETSQQSGSEGGGTKGFCWKRQKEREEKRNSVAESLAMFVIFRCV